MGWPNRRAGLIAPVLCHRGQAIGRRHSLAGPYNKNDKPQCYVDAPVPPLIKPCHRVTIIHLLINSPACLQLVVHYSISQSSTYLFSLPLLLFSPGRISCNVCLCPKPTAYCPACIESAAKYNPKQRTCESTPLLRIQREQVAGDKAIPKRPLDHFGRLVTLFAAQRPLPLPHSDALRSALIGI